MTGRRLGRPAARRLAACPSLAAALTVLAQTPYGHDVRPGQPLALAQRAIVDTVVWNLRVLAGWAPRDGVTSLRVLLGSLEIVNVEDHLRRLAGGTPPPPYRLGALATAWPRLAVTTSPEQVRAVLATSWWGDPGGTSSGDVGAAMRTCLADRTTEAVPAAGEWAAGATALFLARAVSLGGQLPAPARSAASRVVGPAAVAATGLPQLTAALPRAAAWALAGVDHPEDLWRAEARWWSRVERDATELVRRALPGPHLLVATVGLLAVDAWRVRAALEVAARGGGPLEVFDAVA
jgi:hypothetical protein